MKKPPKQTTHNPAVGIPTSFAGERGSGKKNIVVLGSTGSIGKNTLDVIRCFPDTFQVIGLVACSNDQKLEAQTREFSPKIVSLTDVASAARLRTRMQGMGVEVRHGIEGACEVAAMDNASLVVSGIVGSAGLRPTLAAIQAGKTIALANKEVLVMAGEFIQREARQRHASIIPIDSEHSAIFQAMAGSRREVETPAADVRRIILTASGGPLLGKTHQEKASVSLQEVLSHPTWKMGPKISVDCATLINKGFEVMEAHWLFNLPPDRIDVIVHRQSIIHSMVEFVDRSVIAQMGLPDMRVPIAYALHYPNRAPLQLPSLDLAAVGQLTFEQPDRCAFPLLSAAYEALKVGGAMPAVLNAANEEAVTAFLAEKIRFVDIPHIVRDVMDTHVLQTVKAIEDLFEADAWARREASRLIGRVPA